jgi:hypothetical protein
MRKAGPGHRTGQDTPRGLSMSVRAGSDLSDMSGHVRLMSARMSGVDLDHHGT